MSFKGKNILYTGAAGGLGLGTTLEFLKTGATVIAIDNDPRKSADLQRAVANGSNGRCVVERIDLADIANLRWRLDALSERVGGFDVVINNAAIYPAKSFEDYTIDEFHDVQKVNVEAGVICVQAALPHMKARQWGRIINIASVTFSGGWANLAPYVASKGALIGLTRAWAREFGPYGITVNAISPGAFPTDAEAIHPDPEGYNRFVLERQALKRRGEARDIANALKFFISDQSSFITGQTLNVDGGWVMN